ncbi:hypothetical protein [Streptomyces abikoensis]|uniref:hypothetical protein n=1 Tax=Streptomyces abikoensis TaxID=97398 RepID=UPI001E400C69|nr:hypothetical protein [Streptomyces abikoensis]
MGHRPAHRPHRLDLQRDVAQIELGPGDLPDQILRLRDELLETLHRHVPDPLRHE